jgi:hypothetical protein
VYIIDRLDRKENLPFRSKLMNTCDSEVRMGRTRETSYTYHRWNLSDSGKEEPNETLANAERISGQQIASSVDNTCFHMRCPRPYTPDSWKPKRSKPTSMMRSKTTSVVRVVIRLSFVLWMLVITQVDIAGTHAVRIWGLG